MKPYVTRALQDEEVRENVKHAIAAAREIYDELLGGRSTTAVATRVATDKDIQDQLKTAIDDLRKAANRVQGKKEHGTRNATLLIAGIALGILFNPMTGPQTREWISNKLLGGEESSGSGSSSLSGNGSA
ncbi:MAG TPA: hypothetical protein VFL41_10505 [Gaiellaceae bacterium]|nr:hypothetical protein [Gaiellaceae bacterium]HET8652270.1 hypothetical protein [Gaiellaceae bacterium]